MNTFLIWADELLVWADELLIWADRAPSLSGQVRAELCELVESNSSLFCHADDKGVMPIHWLCGSTAVSVQVLQQLLDTLPCVAACVDSRSILPLHWCASNSTHVVLTCSAPFYALRV